MNAVLYVDILDKSLSILVDVPLWCGGYDFGVGVGVGVGATDLDVGERDDCTCVN